MLRVHRTMLTCFAHIAQPSATDSGRRQSVLMVQVHHVLHPSASPHCERQLSARHHGHPQRGLQQTKKVTVGRLVV